MSQDITGLATIEQIVRKHGWPTDQFDVGAAMVDFYDTRAEAKVATGHSKADYAAEKVACLSVAERTVFLGLVDAVTGNADLQTVLRRGGDHRLLVTVRVPTVSWIEPFRKAYEAWIASVVDEHGFTCETFKIVAGEVEYRRQSSERADETAVFSALETRHVSVAMVPADRSSWLIAGARDADLMPAIDSVNLERSLQLHYGIDRPIDGIHGFEPGELDPKLLDLAVLRAASLDQAFDFLVRLSAQYAQDKRREMEAREKQAKPSSSSSSSSKPSPVEITHPSEPTLQGLHGYGAAAVWGRQLADDVLDYQRENLTWRDVDAGCLLFGPPGTGKTLFASALAATCGLPFIASSFAQWQGARGGYLGDVVKAIRSTFETANANAPCIVFIDEIDSIPARGRSSQHDDYWTPIVTALLEVLDGTNRREGVIVIAACNHADRLDPALVRSGRLDRRFEIGLPDEDALTKIFGHHLPEISADVIAPVATALAGSTSGADVARIAREARRSARREKRDLVADDLLMIALPPDDRPAALRWQTAVHEAGHAVAMMTTGIVPSMLSLIATESTQGGVLFSQGHSLGRVADFDTRIVSILAGRAAEEVVLGQVSGGAGGIDGSDLQVATTMLGHTMGLMGLGDRIAYSGNVEGNSIELRLRRLYAEAVLLISRHRSQVIELAGLALERRVLGQPALKEFATKHGLGAGL